LCGWQNLALLKMYGEVFKCPACGSEWTEDQLFWVLDTSKGMHVLGYCPKCVNALRRGASQGRS